MWWHGFWWFVPLGWLVFLLFIVLAFWSHWHRWGRHSHWHANKSAEEIVADRFARGEINEEEYRTRLDVLRKHFE